MQKGGERLDILSFFTFSSQLEKVIFFPYQPSRKLNGTEKVKVSAVLTLLHSARDGHKDNSSGYFLPIFFSIFLTQVLYRSTSVSKIINSHPTLILCACSLSSYIVHVFPSQTMKIQPIFFKVIFHVLK